MSKHVGGDKGRNNLRHLRHADERLRINRGRPVQLFLKLIAIVLMFRDKLPAAYCFNE